MEPGLPVERRAFAVADAIENFIDLGAAVNLHLINDTNQHGPYPNQQCTLPQLGVMTVASPNLVQMQSIGN